MRALCRDVPESFARAIAARAPDPPIDVGRAREQHAAYVAGLGALGVEVTRLAADEALPDCCFVEDTAVVAGSVALVTRPGAEARRGEVAAVAAALGGWLEAQRMEAPATFDGGDCLLVGRSFYVGLSARTNRAGVDRLAEAFPGHRVVAIEVPPQVLHLKSVCSPIGEAVLLAEGTIDPRHFDAEVLLTAEAHAANAVAVGGGVLLAPGAPWTRALLERRGLRVVEVDSSELRKADGALTCLSILF